MIMAIEITFPKQHGSVPQSRLAGASKRYHSNILRVILQQHKYVLKSGKDENDEGVDYLKFTTELKK